MLSNAEHNWLRDRIIARWRNGRLAERTSSNATLWEIMAEQALEELAAAIPEGFSTRPIETERKADADPT